MHIHIETRLAHVITYDINFIWCFLLVFHYMFFWTLSSIIEKQYDFSSFLCFSVCSYTNSRKYIGFPCNWYMLFRFTMVCSLLKMKYSIYQSFTGTLKKSSYIMIPGKISSSVNFNDVTQLKTHRNLYTSLKGNTRWLLQNMMCIKFIYWVTKRCGYNTKEHWSNNGKCKYFA